MKQEETMDLFAYFEEKYLDTTETVIKASNGIALKRLNELVDVVKKHDYLYYTLDTPEISNAEYNALYNELRRLEETTGIIRPDSPTQRVGGELLEGLPEHKHLARLWSLDKRDTKEEVHKWAARVEKLVADYNLTHEDKLPPIRYSLELKFDGLTINLTFTNGKLVQIATRGNGKIGESVLGNGITIRSIPMEIPYTKGTIEVQGEAILRLSTLKEYNKTLKEPLDPRNGAAGTLRTLNTKVAAARKLDAYFYQVGYSETEFKDYNEMMDFLKENHFKVHPYSHVYDSITEVVNELDTIVRLRPTLDFQIDGAVIKIVDFKTRRILGNTAKHPRWGLAYKFEAEQETPIFEEVVVDVGRSGQVAPRAKLSPTVIGGVTVNFATLNNYENMREKGLLNALGTPVYVRRSNDVIPEILGKATTEVGRRVEIPTHCPSCHSELLKVGAHHFCLNHYGCRSQIINRLIHFSSREAMKIVGFGEETAIQMHDKLMIHRASELYVLTMEQLLQLEGFKEQKAKNLLAAIQNSKETTLQRFIFSLGIPDIGEKTAETLADHFGSLLALRNASFEELMSIPTKVGKEASNSILSFFNDKEEMAHIELLLAAGIKIQEVEKVQIGDTSNPFFGKTVVITGTFVSKKRAELTSMLKSKGAKVSGSVSKKTDFVIAGSEAGNKLTTAEDLGVKVLSDEDEIIRLLS